MVTDVLLYDGWCRICVRSAKELAGWLPAEKVTLRSFRDDGVFEEFPSVDPARAEKGIQLVRDDGRVLEGAEAIVQVFRHRPVLGVPMRLYYLPGLRWLANRLYQYVADRRFQIAGRTGECDGGTCGLHMK